MCTITYGKRNVDKSIKLFPVGCNAIANVVSEVLHFVHYLMEKRIKRFPHMLIIYNFSFCGGVTAAAFSDWLLNIYNIFNSESKTRL